MHFHDIFYGLLESEKLPIEFENNPKRQNKITMFSKSAFEMHVPTYTFMN